MLSINKIKLFWFCVFGVVSSLKVHSQILFPQVLKADSVNSIPVLGYVNMVGKKAIEPNFSYCNLFYSNCAVARTQERTFEYGYINNSGKLIVPCQYTNAFDFKEGRGRVYKSLDDDKYGFIDSTGKLIIPLIYEYASDFNDGLALVYDNGKMGYIDRAGKWVITLDQSVNAIRYPFQLISYARQFYEGLAAVKYNERWGFINKKGEMVIVPQYEQVANFGEGYCAVKKNNKWVWIDKMGKVFKTINTAPNTLEICDQCLQLNSNIYGMVNPDSSIVLVSFAEDKVVAQGNYSQLSVVNKQYLLLHKDKKKEEILLDLVQTNWKQFKNLLTFKTTNKIIFQELSYNNNLLYLKTGPWPVQVNEANIQPPLKVIVCNFHQ